MTTDDFAALGWISIGAMASAALTVGLLTSTPPVPEAPVHSPDAHAPHADPDRPIVDFAIIREDGAVLTVGPERPGAGWAPDVDERPWGRGR